MHLNEINKNETNLGFWAEPAYAGPRRCVRMHEPTYITLPNLDNLKCFLINQKTNLNYIGRY